LGTRFPVGSAWHGRWGIALALVPPLLAVGLFQAALDEPLFGLAGLLFGVAVLFYAWGPRDLDVDVDAIADARDLRSRRAAAAALWPDDGAASLDGGALVGAVFRSALRRWFGVLFWFLLLGPLGALLYRLVVLSAEGATARSLPSENSAGARTVLAILDWPVAQLMTLALALVGNFDTVLGAWRDAGGASFNLDSGFLGAAARASVRVELAEEAADQAEELAEHVASGEGNSSAAVADMPELRDAMSLVWRSLLVWLAVLALFVIAGFVG
jgi:AmpE protein